MTRPVPARVVAVAGPSGTGKTVLCARLAAELGWPVVHLDDFFRDGDDPSLPMIELAGGGPLVDWDDPGSWAGEDALAALSELCSTGVAELPIYAIGADRRTGSRQVRSETAAIILAEGIFADLLAAPLRDRGLLAAAVCLRQPSSVVFVRRLLRDLRERRKPPTVALRRGMNLLRTHREVVERAVRHGCTPLSTAAAYAMLRGLGSSG